MKSRDNQVVYAEKKDSVKEFVSIDLAFLP